ncbi:MAG: hypothetical protein WCK34_11925 [Bacteroidota bacterium]
MKKLTLLLLVGLGMVLFASLEVSAQKIKLESGNFTALKGQTNLNIEYVYDNLSVGKKSEDEYIKGKVSDYNAKEPGKGDKWLTSWKNDRPRRYQPKFEELMDKYLSSKGIKVGAFANAKYTVIVKTTMIEPGWNVGVMRRPALINVTVSVVETANRANEIAKVTIEKSPGAGAWGYDFDTGLRIQEAYAKCGKELAKLMIKKGLK